MKCRAGFLTVACAWVAILIRGLDAGRAPRRHAAGDSCQLKELMALTRSLVEKSLTDFDRANGEHLGSWSPGFPELQVHRNSPLNGSEVQCSLFFMAKGLKEVRADQKDDLNPSDESLHEELTKTISTVNTLALCTKTVLGGECSPKPAAPKMPDHAFEKKQWSHTLLEKSRVYLEWMERSFGVQIPKVKGKDKIKRKHFEATLQKYFEGSGYPL